MSDAASRGSGDASPWPAGRQAVLWAWGTVAAMIACGLALRLSGYVGGAYSWFLHAGALDDSWMPMGRAYASLGNGALYDLFFVDHVKFQYPPSSLLIYTALDVLAIRPDADHLNGLVWLSILAMPVVVFLICRALLVRDGAAGIERRWVIPLAFAVGVLFFYPVMIAWRLGQVQAFLNLFFALACLLRLHGRRFGAGLCIGLICLVKPQFSLFLLWALVRRDGAFAAGQALALGAGLAVSVALYGFGNHVAYLSVLAYISERGEIFWDNTSVNGLMNGLMFPGEVLRFDYASFPPVHPIVRAATFWSSAAILAYALVPRGSGRDTAELDFLTAAVAFTLAAPIAWGHHYGIAFPVLAIVFVAILGDADARRRRLRLILWSLCLVAIGNDWNVSERLAGTLAAPLQAWRLVAVVTLLVLLHRLQGSVPEHRLERWLPAFGKR